LPASNAARNVRICASGAEAPSGETAARDGSADAGAWAKAAEPAPSSAMQ